MSSSTPTSPLPDVKKGSRIVIVTAEWNGHITSELHRAALETLTANGILPSDITSIPVPGTVELTFAASRAIHHLKPDAVIIFGAVVRGDTPHFDYVCSSITQGMTLLNATGSVPVIFGVLTVDNEQQALDRIGGPAGHKGVEAAETALRMIALADSL
ncbi:MAG: 6,7-dimethyl-8-ribityllumazine synthase [Pseudoflavonifractor sp.]|nr:6,7-dimethyl-8-ribityllumazine synthase [Alloprevotella sp.]MCM1117435.1 6,7-dimethyl-8-ribityllumazine synthase [Pseudoflavonifractor sp.]